MTTQNPDATSPPPATAQATFLNNHQVTFEPDGSFRIVVAHRHPGTANWLVTAGHRHGYVMFCWMQATKRHPADLHLHHARLHHKRHGSSGATP